MPDSHHRALGVGFVNVMLAPGASGDYSLQGRRRHSALLKQKSTSPSCFNGSKATRPFTSHVLAPTRAAYADGSFEVTNSAVEAKVKGDDGRGCVAVAEGDCTGANGGIEKLNRLKMVPNNLVDYQFSVATDRNSLQFLATSCPDSLPCYNLRKHWFL
jgi:hypothetical protein